MEMWFEADKLGHHEGEVRDPQASFSVLCARSLLRKNLIRLCGYGETASTEVIAHRRKIGHRNRPRYCIR